MRAPSPRRMGFDLRERLLDRRAVGRVRRQEEQRAAARFEGLANAGGLVDAQIIEHDHLPWPQRRPELLRDVPGEGLGIHRPLDQPGHVQAVGGERRHQRGVLAVVARHRAGRSPVVRRPAVEARQGDVRAAFVDEDELLGVELGDRLPARPPAPPRHARWLPVTFFMRPAEATQRSPHRHFAQLLPLVLRPPGAVLQDRRVGRRLPAGRAAIASCSGPIARGRPGIGLRASEPVSRWRTTARFTVVTATSKRRAASRMG